VGALQVAQPISKTALPHNCLFDEFRRIYNMAYDLAIEGLHYLPPKSGNLERSDRG